MVLIGSCGGKEAGVTQRSQYFILQPQFPLCFSTFPRTPQVGAVEGEVDSSQILKKACLDGTLIGMTRRGQGQGGDPVRPLGEKQWVSLVPK